MDTAVAKIQESIGTVTKQETALRARQILRCNTVEIVVVSNHVSKYVWPCSQAFKPD